MTELPTPRIPLLALLNDIAKLGRNDLYSAFVQGKEKGYHLVRAPITDQVIARHAGGEQPVAIYPVEGDTTRIAVLDIDNHEGREWAHVVEAALPIVQELIADGFKPWLVRSGGGNGIHIWLFWRDAQLAQAVRQYMLSVLLRLNLTVGTAGIANGAVEIYPKQEKVADGSVGNPIALPMSRQSLPLDNTLQPISLEGYRVPQLTALFSPDLDTLWQSAESDSHRAGERRFLSEILPGDIEEARSALKYIVAEDYDLWIRVALILKRAFGTDGFDIWHEWSAGCASKYPGRSVCEKVWAGLKPNGSIGIGSLFFLAQQKGWNGPSEPVIREMNTRFGILTQGSHTRIIDKLAVVETDELFIHLSKQPFIDRLRPEGHVGEERQRQLKAAYWFNHPKADHYHQVIFDPSKPPGKNGQSWNLWKGFAVTPVQGDWSLLQDHILKNICSGDPILYAWVMNWMALAVQRPADVIGTAPVFRGLPGTGKGFLAHQFAALWGPHGTTVTHQNHVAGHFNAHLFGKRFVFVDEGLFGGDKQSAGLIKTRITEPFILLEAKGMDAIRIPNRMIYMVASNNESVVAADIGERRWMVIDVSAAKKEDHAYFAAIDAQMRSGGREAMLYDLLTRNWRDGPDPRRVIANDAQFSQVLRGMEPTLRYVHQILDEGRLPQYEHNDPGRTTTKALWKELQETQPDGKWVTPEALGRVLSKKFVGLVQKRPNGHYFVRQGSVGPVNERSMEYRFADLRSCRRRFEEIIGQKVPWSNDQADWVSLAPVGADPE